MNISGSGSLPGGEYNEGIHISGSGKINGSVSCSELVISGSGKVEGDLNCSGIFRISGSGKILGAVRANACSISGSGKVEGPADIAAEMKVSGAGHTGPLRCTELRVSGSYRANGDVSAERAVIRGAIGCDGLLNAGELDIVLGGDCSADSVGGSTISVSRAGVGFFASLFGIGEHYFTVRNSIEGDTIKLENVIADSVIGRDVTIGRGCRIRYVSYIDHIEIDSKANVERYECAVPSNTPVL